VPFLEYDFTKPVGFASFQGALADPAAVARAAIPVERIHGPVLLINGADDALWPSPEMAAAIMARLAARDHDYRDQHLTYPGAGHIIPLPNEPTTAAVGPGIGGTPEAVAHAARDAWPRLLQFLQRRFGGPAARLGGARHD
jgi:dienelactone hydrolase